MKKHIAFIIMVLVMLPSYIFADVESPDNFAIDATSSTIIVTWTANTNVDGDSYDDTEGYYIDYWKTDDVDTQWTVQLVGVTRNSFTITGLEAGEGYTVRLTAYSGDTESTSDTDTITTDSFDTDDINIVISGVDEITISIDAEGSNVEEYSVKVGTTSGGVEIYGSLTSPVEIDNDDSLVVSGLTVETIYYVVVTVLPDNTELSAIPFTFEATRTFLSESEEEIENGCFITSSAKNPFTFVFSALIISIAAVLFSRRSERHIFSVLMLVFLMFPAQSFAGDTYIYKNYFGIKGGLFQPNESDQKDVYEEIVPFSLYYERILTDHFSVDIDLGYSKSDGAALSTSSTSTELVTELEMYPAAVSINFNYDVAPYITAYIGAGGDWWVVEEKSEIGEFDSEVGGWHAKTGLKIFSDELETFKQVGCLLDISYTQIDRFGSNEIDLGGWKFNLGLFYCL